MGAGEKQGPQEEFTQPPGGFGLWGVVSRGLWTRVFFLLVFEKILPFSGNIAIISIHIGRVRPCFWEAFTVTTLHNHGNMEKEMAFL
ncbi:hypothetical protein D5272_04785 [bacterium D16-76]|nr:hypothetical protein [bacterium D16-76]